MGGKEGNNRKGGGGLIRGENRCMWGQGGEKDVRMRRREERNGNGEGRGRKRLRRKEEAYRGQQCHVLGATKTPDGGRTRPKGFNSVSMVLSPRVDRIGTG